MFRLDRTTEGKTYPVGEFEKKGSAKLYGDVIDNPDDDSFMTVVDLKTDTIIYSTENKSCKN